IPSSGRWNLSEATVGSSRLLKVRGLEGGSGYRLVLEDLSSVDLCQFKTGHSLCEKVFSRRAKKVVVPVR
ncbi:MAG: hypothetical protein ACYC6Y_26730, partial [Thermoguttaceae bacterium]